MKRGYTDDHAAAGIDEATLKKQIVAGLALRALASEVLVLAWRLTTSSRSGNL